MAIAAADSVVDSGIDARRRARFRWDLQGFLKDCLATAGPLVIRGRLQPDLRKRLTMLLQRHRLYREALDAHKLFHRAVDWSISHERITFSIERHPLGVVLFQTWAVDVRTGSLTKTRETYLGLQRSQRAACTPAA